MMISLKTLFLIPLLLTLAACSTNPATGGRQFNLVSPALEQAAGAQSHQQIEQDFGFYDNPALTAMVQRIGNTLARDTERPDILYNFVILDTPVVNAFAAPGGYIYVTRGLMATMNDEAELAGIIGHEIGHVTARHGAEGMSRDLLSNIALGLLGEAIDSTAVMEGLALGAEINDKRYSRGDEHEADMLGVRYLAANGYDPEAMTRGLRNIERYADMEMRRHGVRDTPLFLRTHPYTPERIARTTQLAAAVRAQAPHATFKTNPVGYLSALESLTYGPSARFGFVKDDTFIHPELGFLFGIPEGFSIRNRKDSVQGHNKDGVGFRLDAVRNTHVGLEKYLRDMWLPTVPLRDIAPMTINGKAAITGWTQKQTSKGWVVVRYVVIAMDAVLYRFQLAMPARLQATFEDRVMHAPRTFRAIRPDEIFKPQRLRIRAVKAGDTVARLAALYPKSLGTRAERQELFRVLNGLDPDDSLVAGRLVKMIAE